MNSFIGSRIFHKIHFLQYRSISCLAWQLPQLWTAVVVYYTSEQQQSGEWNCHAKQGMDLYWRKIYLTVQLYFSFSVPPRIVRCLEMPQAARSPTSLKKESLISKGLGSATTRQYIFSFNSWNISINSSYTLHSVQSSKIIV